MITLDENQTEHLIRILRKLPTVKEAEAGYLEPSIYASGYATGVRDAEIRLRRTITDTLGLKI